MTSFAGSKLHIDIPAITSAGGTGSYATDAAGSVADNYSILAKKRPKADEIYGLNTKLRSEEQAAAWDAERYVNSLGLKAVTSVAGKDMQLKQQKDAANKQKEGAKWGAAAGVLTAGIGLLSDERTKHTIEKLDDVTLMLRELNPVSFYYKSEYTGDTQRRHYGFIAQEYKDVMPEATHYNVDSGLFTIDTNQLIALLVKGYQQLDNRITRMEAKNVLAGVS